MNTYWLNMFSGDGFMPHGHCYFWTSELLWLYVASDSIIALAYYSIPVALLYFVRRRPDLQFNWIFVMFSLFIFACGTTHVLSIVTIWKPLYWLDAQLKALTAIVSIATAVALWPLIPKALRIPGTQRLEEAVNWLEQEIDARMKSQEELAQLNASLEARVHERTQELELANLRMSQEIEARKQIEHALYLEKERALVTVKSIADGVITTNTEGQIATMNPVAERITGWSEIEAKGQAVEKIFRLVEEESLQAVLSPIQKVLETGEVHKLADRTLLLDRHDHSHPIEDSAAPILDGSGNVLGTVLVFHDVSDARKLAQQMSYIAQHDFLTKLPNRVLLADRLIQAIAHAQRLSTQVALIFLDIDNFKNVNDTLGHNVGDAVLKEVAQRLLHCVRGSDTICRLGGDEFVLLLQDLHNNQALGEVAQKLLKSAAMPFQIEQNLFQISLSIGIAVYPQDGESPETLLRHADVAMYRAKKSGKNNFHFYNPADQASRDE